MSVYTQIKEAQETIVNNWHEAGEEVIAACFYSNPFKDSFEAFLSHCTPCGGNWGGLLLSGIAELYPEVYNAIPDDMGLNAFNSLVCVLILLGVYI